MFVLLFALFVFVFTVFENILLGRAMFVLLAVCLLFKNKFLKNILLLVVAFLLAFGAVSIKQYTYNQKIPQNRNNLLFKASSEPQSASFIGTGLIADKHSVGRYILTDGDSREYFLYSENNYSIGEEIFLQGNYKPGLTGLQLLYHIKSQIEHVNIFKKNIGPQLSGLFHYQFNYPKRLMMKGMYGTIYEKSSIPVTQQPLNLISKTKAKIQKMVVQKYGENRVSGLILGMLIGDKSQIPEAEYDQFVSSGLVHIIAVSGGNILMIVVFLSAVLFFIPFYVRTAIILSIVIFYALICGMDSSVIRAALMGGLSLLALFWGREIQIWRGIATAFVVMCVYNPYFLVYDVGFMLSFAAIFGLILLQNWQNKIVEKKQSTTGVKKGNHVLKQKIRWLLSYPRKSYFLPTVAASFGVFPVLIFFMGEMNILGILGNIFVIPLIPFVMIYGFLSVFLYQIFHRDFLLQIEEALIQYIYQTASFLTENGIYVSVTAQWLKYVILAAALLAFLRWRLGSKLKHKASSISQVSPYLSSSPIVNTCQELSQK